MTSLAQLLTPTCIRLGADIASKKKALESLAQLLTETDAALDFDATFTALTAREKLGSTAIEHGVAIPHCRVDHCRQPRAAILTLRQGIDFDARDGCSTDILLALIVPTESTDEHLKILALLADTLQRQATRDAIRKSTDAAVLYHGLSQLEPRADQPIV